MREGAPLRPGAAVPGMRSIFSHPLRDAASHLANGPAVPSALGCHGRAAGGASARGVIPAAQVSPGCGPPPDSTGEGRGQAGSDARHASRRGIGKVTTGAAWPGRMEPPPRLPACSSGASSPGAETGSAPGAARKISRTAHGAVRLRQVNNVVSAIQTIRPRLKTEIRRLTSIGGSGNFRPAFLGLHVICVRPPGPGGALSRT